MLTVVRVLLSASENMQIIAYYAQDFVVSSHLVGRKLEWIPWLLSLTIFYVIWNIWKFRRLESSDSIRLKWLLQSSFVGLRSAVRMPIKHSVARGRFASFCFDHCTSAAILWMDRLHTVRL
jgi:hypothetical protein